MDGEHCNHENTRKRQADERNECAKEHCQTAEQLNEYCHPCHNVRGGNAQVVKNGNKGRGAVNEFGVSMLHESVASHNSQWKGHPVWVYETLKHGVCVHFETTLSARRR